MARPRIAVIVSSTRDARFADKPAEWLMAQVADHPDLDFEKVDLREQNLPFFNEAASNLWVESKDPNALAWQRKLDGFDGFMFVLAEYNHSVPGALKNAMDQAYKEWNRKPMTALAYGGVGGARALEHLRMIAVELQMAPLRNAVHIGGGDFLKVSPMGEDAPMSEIEDHLAASLKATLEDLVWWTKALKAARAG
ncbi:NAD(P)H-dependent oxidoreductase [Paracoccus sp. (in: a-proteobacteria)]|uniref:NADPH-dependent FMN reductase n=1 Tax=Paracoccus sp. TaxID=267 RepID=UPI0023716F6D|nr:NAD(P)H-dependent oxidoreductase [Paracoccus sp. (in: a-proteobacteria)]MDB2551739.1 NAD(P)H-dependent oxidoreductase [Paracoccus sp. (in: a-proteobacteria)]